MPGIAPRAMSELFRLVEENRGTFDTRVRCYMVELYNDGLVDLLKGKKDEEKPLTIMVGSSPRSAKLDDQL